MTTEQKNNVLESKLEERVVLFRQFIVPDTVGEEILFQGSYLEKKQFFKLMQVNYFVYKKIKNDISYWKDQKSKEHLVQ